MLDSFVDLWKIHESEERHQESKAEKSRQVQEFSFKITSFIRKGLDEGTGIRTVLVNTTREKTNIGANCKEHNANEKALFQNGDLFQDQGAQLLKQSSDSSELHNQGGFIIEGRVK